MGKRIDRISLRRLGRMLATSLLLAIAASAIAPRSPAVPVGTESASALVTVVGSLPSPRSRTSAVWPGNGAAYVFGGRTAQPNQQGTSTTRQIVGFVPGLGSAVVGQLPPTPGSAAPRDGREDTAAIWDGQNAYIFGGYDSSFNPLDEIVRFSPSTGDARVVARLPFPTAGATAIWDGASAYIFGGYVKVPGQTRPLLSGQIVRFTPNAGGGTATLLPQALPSPRNHASAVYETPYVHIYGGHLGLVATDEIVSFAPASGEISVESRLPAPRHDTSAIWLEGSPAGTGNAYVFGGNVSGLDDSPSDEVVAHDPVNGESVRVVDRLVGGKAYASAVASDRIGGYLFGGETPGGGFSDQIERFTRPIRYVALGDSYSSGEGLGEENADPPYLAGGDERCHRHRRAYPVQFDWYGPTQLDFFACSGARTEHIYREPQRSGEGQDYPGQAGYPQLNSSTDLVTMTIGGNDLGKPDREGSGGLNEPLSFCYLHKRCDRNKKFVAGFQKNLRKLRGNLLRTFAAVKEKAGPDTTIAVLGYPRAFPTDKSRKQLKKEQDCADEALAIFIPGFPVGRTVHVAWDPNEQKFLNRGVERLDGVIARAAAAKGVFFFNPTRYFTGHGICDKEGERWINGLTSGEGFFSFLPRPLSHGKGSFHPNDAGHAAYSGFLRGYLQLESRLIAQKVFRGRVTPVGLPANPKPTRPSVKLSEVKTVRLGQASKFRGKASDNGGFGVARATLRFGDGTVQVVRFGRDQTFTLLHRYRRPGKYKVRLVVLGGEGNTGSAERQARVTRRR